MKNRGLLVYISNAAVLLQYNGVKVLIDGIYWDSSGYFSQLPDAVWDGMQKGVGELAHIDYLLFTHSHADHFDEHRFLQYLQKNEVKGYALPCSENALHGCRAIFFDEEKKAQLGEEMTCRYRDIRHLDPCFYNVTNRCYLLEIKGKKILFLADADYYAEAYQEWADEKIDIVFVTPVFYNHPFGRQILQEVLHVEKIILYHLPFPEEDRMQMEKMAVRDSMRYAEEGRQITIWNKTGQSLVF